MPAEFIPNSEGKEEHLKEGVIEHSEGKPEAWTLGKGDEGWEKGVKRDKARAYVGQEDLDHPNEKRNAAVFWRQRAREGRASGKNAEGWDEQADIAEELAGRLYDLKTENPDLFRELKAANSEFDFGDPESFDELPEEVARLKSEAERIKAKLEQKAKLMEALGLEAVEDEE